MTEERLAAIEAHYNEGPQAYDYVGELIAEVKRLRGPFLYSDPKDESDFTDEWLELVLEQSTRWGIPPSPYATRIMASEIRRLRAALAKITQT